MNHRTRRPRGARGAAFAAALTLAGSTAAPAEAGEPRWLYRGMSRHSLRHGGRARQFYLREPRRRRPRYRGLVVSLHGGGGRAWGAGRQDYGRLDELAGRAGYLVAYPDAVEKHWNDGRTAPQVMADYRSARENVDDVGFLAAVITRLRDRFSIPADRVFMCGISNGGRMTLRVLLERPALIRAAGVVVMALDPRLWRRRGPPDPAVPVAFFNGTADPLIPWEGGQVRLFKKRLGALHSSPETFRLLSEGYGCRERETSRVPDRADDGIETVRHRAAGCRDGAEVLLYESRGGGHVWPGGRQYLPRRLIGPVTTDFDASAALFEFWGRHGLTPPADADARPPGALPAGQ